MITIMTMIRAMVTGHTSHTIADGGRRLAIRTALNLYREVKQRGIGACLSHNARQPVAPTGQPK
jgi:hypothetical protein